MDFEQYRVEYNGEVTYLNHKLVERRGITPDKVLLLKKSHEERIKIFQAAQATDDPVELRRLAAEFEKLEFYQQELWGFPQDANFHQWYNIPKCTCPKMDNVDNRGTPYRVVDGDCPVHGTRTT